MTAISEMLESPLETCKGHAKNDVGEARLDSESCRSTVVSAPPTCGVIYVVPVFGCDWKGKAWLTWGDGCVCVSALCMW